MSLILALTGMCLRELIHKKDFFGVPESQSQHLLMEQILSSSEKETEDDSTAWLLLCLWLTLNSNSHGYKSLNKSSWVFFETTYILTRVDESWERAYGTCRNAPWMPHNCFKSLMRDGYYIGCVMSAESSTLHNHIRYFINISIMWPLKVFLICDLLSVLPSGTPQPASSRWQRKEHYNYSLMVTPAWRNVRIGTLSDGDAWWQRCSHFSMFSSAENTSPYWSLQTYTVWLCIWSKCSLSQWKILYWVHAKY